MEGFGLVEVLYDSCVGHRTEGALGERGGAITLSTQRATHSPLVFAWPPVPSFLLLILGFFRSSKSL
jgi:hypothetical protein